MEKHELKKMMTEVDHHMDTPGSHTPWLFTIRSVSDGLSSFPFVGVFNESQESCTEDELPDCSSRETLEMMFLFRSLKRYSSTKERKRWGLGQTRRQSKHGQEGRD